MLAKYRSDATIPASDLGRARAFYAEQLGMTPQREEPDGGLIYEGADGTRFLLFQSSGAASGGHTQMAWSVDNVEGVVGELKSRGVVFEEYDLPGLKTVNGIAEVTGIKSAWFKDSEGNLLAITQLP